MPLQFSYGNLPYHAVREFLLETDKEFPIPLSTHVDIDSYAKKLSSLSDFSVCRDGAEIVGMISCYTNHPPVGYVSNVCVKKAYQGAGVFSELFSLLTAQVREKGISKIRLEVDEANNRAQEVYFHMGFTVAESRSDRGKKLLERTI